MFFFPFTDQIAAFKIIMLCLWWGAATSKLNHHFPYVVAVMTSNNALLRSRLFNPVKHLLYLDHVNDLRPSWLPKLMAHVGGTTAEFLVPAVLVFVADGQPWRWFLIGFMVLFHLNILSNLPMGVPLEWNVFFIFSLFYLFGHYGTIAATDLRSPLLLAIVIVAVAVVIAGNLFPEKVSFLPAMRYYAGNWATSVWCFRAGAEDKIEANVVKSSALVVNQLAKLYDAATAEMMADKVAAFRAMHTHGRALNGLLPRALGGEANEADYRVREGEVVAGPLVGWNFGEGHLHNEQLWRRCSGAATSRRATSASSSSKANRSTSKSSGIAFVDAKTGLIEAGYVDVEDMLTRQPWPEPGDEFPVHVTTQRATQMTTAVVVGAGPNGLAAAIHLARHGVDVQVLEARDTIGGGARSGELTVPGVVHDHCSAFHPMGVGSPFWKEIEPPTLRADLEMAGDRLRASARRRHRRRAV